MPLKPDTRENLVLGCPARDPSAESAVPPRATYLTTKDAARVLGLHPDTLRRIRREGGGPPFLRIGRAVRYRLDVVHEWAISRTFKSTAHEAACVREGL